MSLDGAAQTSDPVSFTFQLTHLVPALLRSSQLRGRCPSDEAQVSGRGQRGPWTRLQVRYSFSSSFQRC